MYRRLKRQRKQNEVDLSWTDAEDEVELRLTLPPQVTKKDIDVKVSASYLAITMMQASTPLLEGKLFKLIRSDETHWYIEDRILKVTLSKQVQKHWKKLWDPDAKPKDE